MKTFSRSNYSFFFSLFLCIFLLFSIGTPVLAAGEPSRVINIVYDDSGSMYTTDGRDVDTWCQAKYAMEVFVSMMGDNDTINIYYMSDFDTGAMPGPRLSLFGRDGVASNVSAIHNETTHAANTPFNTVRKAYKDLDGVEADKKWLVVLTDGAFEDGAIPESEVNKFFKDKSENINVCYLGIGDKASVIKQAPNQNIFSYHAVSNSDILHNITNISSRIFERNRLDVNISDGSVSFDVSMQELIVFAQGADVKINGIKSSDGKLVQSTGAPVTVSYSECDADNKNNAPTRELVGKIASFKTDFSAGSYTVDVSGAETLEVYYKPNLELSVSLLDKDGNPVEITDNMQAGDYTLVINLQDPVTHSNVNTSSKLLGDIELNAKVSNNGKLDGKLYHSGDKIHLDEGQALITSTARYLDYNVLSFENSFSVIRNKAITFDVLNNPSYVVNMDGFESFDYVVVHAKVDGREFTDEEWSSLDMPSVSITKELDLLGAAGPLGTPVIEKTDEVGTFRICPTFAGDKPGYGTYQETEYQISCSQIYGNETWAGNSIQKFNISDVRPWYIRHFPVFIRLLILAIILFVLAGYLPIFKNYLPKKLQARPYIRSSASKPGQRALRLSGETKKNLLSTIIPYVPQTGTIKFVPRSYSAPLLHVRAQRQNRMLITNLRQFAGKKEYKFEGESIPAGANEPMVIGAGTIIESKLKGVKLTCYLNQKN